MQAFDGDVAYSESLDTLFATALKENTETTTTLSAMEPMSRRVIWDRPFPNEIWRVCPFPDLNGDGLNDIIVSVWVGGGPVVALNADNGSAIWSTQLHPDFRPELIALMGDVSGDGVPDLAVATGWGRGLLYVLSGADGRILWGFSASPYVQSDIYDVLAPGDLDGDGRLDLMASFWDNSVHALSFSGLPSALDTEPPTIANVAISPNPPTMGEIIKVSASIEDALSGVIEASIFYSTDGGTTWQEVAMSPTLAVYEGTVETHVLMTRMLLYIKAMDASGNSVTSPTQEFNVLLPLWFYGVLGITAVVLILVVLMYLRKPRSRMPLISKDFPQAGEGPRHVI